MKTNYRDIFEAIGSMFDLMPSTDYSKFVPKDTDEELMHQAWQQAGDDIQQATEQFFSELGQSLGGAEYIPDEQRDNGTSTGCCSAP